MKIPIRKEKHDVTIVFGCCYICHRVEFTGTGGNFCNNKDRHGFRKGGNWDHERCYLKTLYNESISPRFIKR